jgi:hypothetical protein
MKTSPTKSAAWEQDSFWREVVAVLTGGKKLRGEHYLQRLSAEELEQLRSALACSGTLLQQQQLCPKRVGGPTDGSLPPVSLLSEIAQAVREVMTLRALSRQDLISAATKDRCGQLGLDPQLTNAVVRVVAEEALRQQAENQVGNFAISAANVLLTAEGMRTKGKQEDVKIELKKISEQRQQKKLDLEREKFELEAAEKMLSKALRAKADEINNSNMSNADKIAAMRREAFRSVDELQQSGKVKIPKA